LFVRLNEPRPEAAAEPQREEQALRKDIEQARAEIERLREQCAALENKSALAVRLASDLEAARAEGRRVEKLAVELTALRKERDELVAKQSGHTQEVEQHRQKVVEISRELDASVRRHEDTQKQHTQLENERRRIEQESAKHQEEAKQHKLQLEDAKRRLDQEIAARDEQLRLAREEADSVRRERDAAHLERDSLQGQAQDWERERGALLDQSHRDHAEKLDAMERQWREQQAHQLSERQSQLDALRQELDKQRQAHSELAAKASQDSERLRCEHDAAREAGEALRRQKDAEHQALQDRLAEVSRSAQSEQEHLHGDLGRADAARRQLEQERLALQAEAQRLRRDLDSTRQDVEEARKSVEERFRVLNEDLERGQQEREALRRERDAIKEQAAQELEKAQKEGEEQVAVVQRDFDHEAEMLRKDASRQMTLAESLKQERDLLRRRIESMQQQSREKIESWESERQSLLGKVQAANQQFTELDKRFRAEQTSVEELKKQIEATRDAAPADVVRMRQDLEALRGQLDAANAEVTKARQQIDQRGQGWSVEKKSLQGHHQEECRRLTEEFEQRLKSEMTRCRESYQDQLETLQRERDTARSQFDALKQAVYHPEQPAGEEDDGIPRLPEPDEEAPDENSPTLEQRLIAEQNQLQTQVRKGRQLLDDQRRQFDEEKQALIAEANRLRQHIARQEGGAYGLTPGAGRQKSSLLLRFLWYLTFFPAAIGTVVIIKVAIDWFNKQR
jgi:chromosome segregation ATPase